ncbi:MAG: hypothetical protein Q7U74_05230 [Saprospiraceae bacterium]|nr:hypothetical protein [Saprospiraceae bacterium]
MSTPPTCSATASARSSFALGLVFAAGLSTLVNVSPVRTLSRLAVGDVYTGLPDVLIFAALLAALSLVLLRVTRRLMV